MSFEDDYQFRLSRWSDIVYALPRFYETVLRYPQCAVLELGTRGGESTSAFLAAADKCGGHVWSVDIDPGVFPVPVPSWWYQSDVWTFLCLDDMDERLALYLPDRRFDVLLIDTSHRYDHTLAELRKFVPMMNPGGTVFLHDTLRENFAGETGFPVRRALDAYCAETGRTWTEHGGEFGLGEFEIPA